jgi:hypothetical protein
LKVAKYQKALPYSPARERLRDLIAHRKEAAEALAEAQSRVERLARVAQAVGPHRAKLSELDSREAREFADWSASPPGSPMPATDAATRAKLQAELDEATAAAQAADRASAGVNAEAAAAVRKMAAIDSELGFAADTVALEEMADIEDAARDAVAKLAAARMQATVFSGIVDSVRDGKDMNTPGWSEYTTSFVDAADRVAAAFRLPNLDEAAESEFRAKAHALMADLRSDASSRLHF